MTTNLKERFEEKFKTALIGSIRGIYCVSHNAPASRLEILAFIKQELELLAEEVEELPTDNNIAGHIKIGRFSGIKAAAAIIRNRAKELE